MFRKVAPQSARRFGPANEFNKHVVLVASRAQFNEILANYRRWRTQFLDDRANCCRASVRARRSCRANVAHAVVHAEGPVSVVSCETAAVGFGGDSSPLSPLRLVLSSAAQRARGG
jgi:hypothetical protein